MYTICSTKIEQEYTSTYAIRYFQAVVPRNSSQGARGIFCSCLETQCNSPQVNFFRSFYPPCSHINGRRVRCRCTIFLFSIPSCSCKSFMVGCCTQMEKTDMLAGTGLEGHINIYIYIYVYFIVFRSPRVYQSLTRSSIYTSDRAPQRTTTTECTPMLCMVLFQKHARSHAYFTPTSSCPYLHNN